MPDQKITDLGDGGLPQPTDDFVVARAGTNNKLAWSSLAAEATVGNVAVTLDGNTAGALALVSSGTLTLAGGNNITLSQAGNAVTISGPNVGGAQTGISGLANSETTYTSGTVSLSELGAITIRSTTGQQFQFSVNAQSVQPETQTFIAGISASDTLYTSGNVRFTGSQAVTVRSGTGQLVVIDVPVQSVQPETQTFIAGISASDTLYTSGNVRFTGVGGGVTVSSNTGQRVDISVAAQSVQPETQTFLAGLGNSQTTYTSGTVNLSVVAGNLTIRSTTGQAFQFSMSQTVQPETQTAISGIANSQTTYTSGTVSLSELGAITIRSTTGNQYQFSVNAQTTQTQGILSVGVSTGGNSSGDTGVATGSRLVFAGGNNITVSQGTAAGATTITISAGAGGAGFSGGMSTNGNTSGDTGYASQRLNLVGGANVTLSGSTNAGSMSITVSAPNSSSLSATGIVSISTNGSTISIGAPAYSGGMSTNGNTSGDTGYASQRLNLVGGNNITLSGSTNGGSMSLTISAPNLGAGAMSAGVSTGGNTAGSTGITGTQLVLVGTNMISLSQSTGANGGTVSINATQSVQTQGILSMGVSTGGATSGDTTVNTGSRMVFVGTNATLSQGTAAGASTITISVPATSSLSATGQVSISTNVSTISIGVPNPLLSYRWIEDRLLMGATQGVGNSGATNTTVTAWVQPLTLPNDLAFNNILLAAHNSFSSNTTSISSVNYSYSMGASVGFYTLTGSTMSLVTSFSNSLAYTNATAANVTGMSLGATVGYGGSSTTKSTGGGANMSAIMSSINSVRQVPMNWTTLGNTLTRGQYWAVVAFSALTGGANQASLSQVGFVSNYSIIGSAINPPELMQNTASVTSPYPFLGQATLVNSSNELMPNSFNTSKITTATAIANSSKFQSIWMRIYSSHSN